MDNTIYETQRKFKIERTVNIDDETVILKVLGDIDMVKGTWKTTRPRTTLTFSSNPDQNAAVASQLNSMEQEMMSHLETIRQNLANGEGDADDLFSGLDVESEEKFKEQTLSSEVTSLELIPPQFRIADSELDKLNTDL